MSAENLKIKYPFDDKCHECPIAKLTIKTAKNTNLHTDRETELVQLGLICLIDNEDPDEPRATVGAMRQDRWISSQKLLGGGNYTERWEEYTTKFHDTPPDKCPQLPKKNKEDI